MDYLRKIKAGLVRVDINDFIGEEGNIFFNINTGELRLSDGHTPGGLPINAESLISLTNPQASDFLVYNSQTNKFTNTPVNLSGGTINQVLVKKSNTNYDYQWEDMNIEKTYTKLLDQYSSTILYVGEAVPNSLPSQSVWRIKKIIFDNIGNIDEVRYASGGLFDQIWDNRVSLNYL